MNLVRALRIAPNEAIALVGAGGKTTAIFQVARQLTPPVIVSTTTHLSIPQASFADRHLIVRSAADGGSSDSISPEVILVTGGSAPKRSLSWVTVWLNEYLYNITKEELTHYLSKRMVAKPLKAPAEYESDPEFVNLVVHCWPFWLETANIRNARPERLRISPVSQLGRQYLHIERVLPLNEFERYLRLPASFY
jgi:hypothetical protein